MKKPVSGVWVVAVAALSLLPLACRTAEEVKPPPTEATQDTGPHKLGDCTPTPGAPGNEKHVGMYCTLHGNQCSKNPHGTATACAIDYDKRGGNYCMQIFCKDDAQCGEGAVCHGDPGGLAKACVPSGCVKEAAK